MTEDVTDPASESVSGISADDFDFPIPRARAPVALADGGLARINWELVDYVRTDGDIEGTLVRFSSGAELVVDLPIEEIEFGSGMATKAILGV